MTTQTAKQIALNAIANTILEAPKIEANEAAIDASIEAAKKLLETNGYVVSKPKASPRGATPRVAVKANGVSYNKLTDALRAHGFNVQEDWVEVRKGLKVGAAYIKNGVKFEF